MAQRISIPPLVDNNLVRNNCFGQLLSFFRYEGSGTAEVIPGPPNFCRVTNGKLHHAFDIDNQEHADPDSVFPYGGTFVFRFRARGTGKIRGTVRWRLSYFRGDTDLMERSTPEYQLTDEFQDYKLEGTVEDFYACVNDRLSWEVKDGYADITGIGLNYPEPDHSVSFDVPHIVALPGEEFSFNCSGAQKLLCCYGHCENALAPEFLPDTQKVKMSLRAVGGEGMRFVGIGEKANSRKSLFVSVAPPRIVKRMRNCVFDKSPRHLLFFGDSLTAYDAGRNYTDIAGSFLPDSWSYMNAGIGGDDLPRLAKRLKGAPRTYRLEHFAHIWDKLPDEIFMLYGANDSKSAWRNDYKIPSTDRDEERRCLEEIFEVFEEKAPNARVTIISSAPGFYPFQLERNSRLRAQKIQNMCFGIPEHVKNFNRTAREFAEAKGWNYLDFHRICTAHGDLRSLFIPDDGVHMTLSGHQVLAASLLEYLQKRSS